MSLTNSSGRIIEKPQLNYYEDIFISIINGGLRRLPIPGNEYYLLLISF